MRDIEFSLDAYFLDKCIDIEDEGYIRLSDDYFLFSDSEDIRDLITIRSSNSKQKLIDAYEHYVGYYDGETKEELIASLYEIEIDDIILPPWSRGDSIYEYLDCTIKFDDFVSRGYSQGDAIYVVVPSREKIDIEAFKKYADHLFWDMPIVGDLSISFEYTDNFGVNHPIKEEELELHEWLECGYETEINKEGLIKYIEDKYSISIKDKALSESLELEYEDIKYPCYCAA